jgi:hypothetical protein
VRLRAALYTSGKAIITTTNTTEGRRKTTLMLRPASGELAAAGQVHGRYLNAS